MTINVYIHSCRAVGCYKLLDVRRCCLSEAVVGQELLVVRICWLTIAVGCQKLLVVESCWFSVVGWLSRTASCQELFVGRWWLVIRSWCLSGAVGCEELLVIKRCWLSGAGVCYELLLIHSCCLLGGGGLLFVKNCYNISLCDRRMTFQQYGIDVNCVVCSIWNTFPLYHDCFPREYNECIIIGGSTWT